jgi:hypothetical protein
VSAAGQKACSHDPATADSNRCIAIIGRNGAKVVKVTKPEKIHTLFTQEYGFLFRFSQSAT